MTNRITIEDVRPNILQDEGLGSTGVPQPDRTVYAQEDCGTVWRFHKRVPNKHLCTFISAVLCMGHIDPRLWTIVRKGMTRLNHPLSQTEMSFDHNQQEAA